MKLPVKSVSKHNSLPITMYFDCSRLIEMEVAADGTAILTFQDRDGFYIVHGEDVTRVYVGDCGGVFND